VAPKVEVDAATTTNWLSRGLLSRA